MYNPSNQFELINYSKSSAYELPYVSYQPLDNDYSQIALYDCPQNVLYDYPQTALDEYLQMPIDDYSHNMLYVVNGLQMYDTNADYKQQSIVHCNSRDITENTENAENVVSTVHKKASYYNLIKSVLKNSSFGLSLKEIINEIAKIDSEFKTNKTKYNSVRHTLTSEKCFYNKNRKWIYNASLDTQGQGESMLRRKF